MYFERRLRGVLISFILASISFSVGCTRKQEGSAKIKIDMSAMSKSLSSNEIFFTALSVTGPNLPTPVLKNWEKCHDCTATAPSVFEIELKKGSGYLFQFLAVSKDATGALSFLYGDAQKDLNLALETVNIKVSSVGVGAQESDIIGRYLSSTDQGPTGLVAMKFKPSDDKPAMRILYESIFGGWFDSFMVLDGADTTFEYVLIRPDGSEGEKLFSDLTSASPALTPGDHLTKFRFPAGFRMRGDGTTEAEPAKALYFGYFGTGAAAKKSCYAASPSEVDGLYSEAAGTTMVPWDALPPLTAGYAGVEAGGLEASSCASGIDHINRIQFDHSTYAHGHKAGFEGPFLKHPTADPHTYFRSDWNSATQALTLEWAFLPGVFSGVNPISGTSLFYKTNFAGNNDDILDNGGSVGSCDELSLSKGFLRVDLPGSTASYTLPEISRTLLEQNKVKVVLCPYRNNASAPAGIETFSSGIESHGFHHLTRPRPAFKLVGSNTVTSDIHRSNAILNANDRLLKVAITNGFHVLMPQIGHLLQTSDVSGMWFSVDGGAWQTFSVGANPNLTYAGETYSAVSLNDANFSSAISSSADQVVKFKFALVSPSNFGLTSPEYITPDITLVGSANCPSTTLVIKKVSDGSLYDASTFLTADIPLTTSYNESFKLAWSGPASCGEISAPVDYFELSGASTCLAAERDLYFDPDRPFAFRIDPKDTFGADCDFSTEGPTSLALYSPSNAGIDAITKPLSGMTLIHSTEAKKVSPYLTASNPSTPTTPFTLGAVAKKWIASAGQSFTSKILKENDDGRITDSSSSGFAGSITQWNIMGSHFTSNSSTSDFVTLTAGGAADGFAHAQSFMAGSVPGKLLTITRSSNDPVVFVSADSFWGGSPLFVTKNGTDHFIHFLPNSYGSFEGKQLKTLNNGSAITTSSRVFVQPLQGNYGNSHDILAVSYQNKLFMVAVSHDDASAIWSSEITLSDASEVIGISRQDSPSGDLQLFAKNNTTGSLIYYQISLSIYYFNGTTWTVPSAESFAGSEVNLIPFDVAQCGEFQIAVIGTDSSDPSMAKSTVFSRSDLLAPSSSFASATAFLGGQNRGSCMRYHGANESEPIYTAAFYSDSSSPASVPIKMLSYNASGTTQCGLSPSIAQEPDSSAISTLTTATGPVVGFKSGLRSSASNGPTPYFFVAAPLASETYLYRLKGECAAGFSVGLETLGSVPNSAGVSYLNHMQRETGDRHAWIYGSALGLLEVLLD